MNEMIERVARAIEAQFQADWDENAHGFGVRKDKLAIAAIRAMREPTKAMRNAAAAAMSPGKRPTEKRVSDKAKHAIRYRAMIDEILKNDTPKP